MSVGLTKWPQDVSVFWVVVNEYCICIALLYLPATLHSTTALHTQSSSHPGVIPPHTH